MKRKNVTIPHCTRHQHRWTLLLVALFLGVGGLLVLARPAAAATITVDGTTCTLVEAITAANNDNAAGNGCTDGSPTCTNHCHVSSTHRGQLRPFRDRSTHICRQLHNNCQDFVPELGVMTTSQRVGCKHCIGQWLAGDFVHPIGARIKAISTSANLNMLRREARSGSPTTSSWPRRYCNKDS